jgi:hypothetical protein
MDMLLALGVRTVPVVSRGDKYTFAQNMRDVAKFLGLDEAGTEQLPPTELVSRMASVLETASRLIRQIPDDKLGGKLPNRDRTYRVLSFHIFRIPEAFLETARGGTLSTGMLGKPPPDDMQTSAAIADFGDQVRRDVVRWWAGLANKTARQPVDTYYGRQPMHDLLERTTWHSTQHVRQIGLVLETLGITPDRPITPAQMAGLPLPEKVWDE